MGFFLTVAFLVMAPRAGAVELVPCTPLTPPGPVVTIDGSLTAAPSQGFLKALRKGGARLALIKPANRTAGPPALPVGAVDYGSNQSRIGLKGGFELRKRSSWSASSRKVRLTDLKTIARSKGASRVTARIGSRQVTLFKVTKGRYSLDSAGEALYLRRGQARLTAAAAKVIRNRLGLGKVKPRLKRGTVFGSINLYAFRKVDQPPEDPTAETPVEPPVLNRPAGAVNLASGSIDWRVRDSFIRYVSSGDGARAVDGALAGPVESIAPYSPLIYTFKLPFTGGWSDGTDPVNSTTLVQGKGGVLFRHCIHTIDFAVTQPEIELNGDQSRIIFRVKGTDGTAFPDSRAVTVNLRLTDAKSVETVGKTTTYTDIPGSIPTGSAGIFANFYLPGSDFGSLTLSYTTE